MVTSREAFPLHIHEKVRFDAAYGNEKVLGHLYLPGNCRPPYQTVIFVPGAGAFLNNPFPVEEPPAILAFLVKSGRAVFWPVYKGTYERREGPHPPPGSSIRRDLYMHVFKDFFRSIDYLEQRSDIDAEKLAYFGESNGGWVGCIVLAIDRRPKVGVFHSGGLTNYRPPFPETDPINAVPHVKLPLLMINGGGDRIFEVEKNQRRLFELLGTPAKDKSHVIVPDAGHMVPVDIIAREALPWLDKYLGKVDVRPR